MHRTPPKRRGRTAILAASAALAVGAVAAPVASADFSTAPCQGAAVEGGGASFLNLAHQLWKSSQLWRSSAGCGAGAPNVGYQSVGSGKGRTVMGANPSGSAANPDPGHRGGALIAMTEPVRFGASDVAINNTDRAVAEAGQDGEGDDAKIHVIPSAVGAIAMSVNFPDTCQVPPTITGGAANPAYDDADANTASDSDRTARFKTSNEKWIKAWEEDASVDEWGELLGGDDRITSLNTGVKTDQACADQPIVRVVREDNSGTTDLFKDWLDRALTNPPGAVEFTTGFTNQRWPGDPGASPAEDATFKRGPQNQGVAADVNANDGAIGYVELAQAREADFHKSPNAAAANSFSNDDRFWVRIADADGDFHEPSEEFTGTPSYKDPSPTGANCDQATYTDFSNPANPQGTLPPAPAGTTFRSFGDWSKVSGANGPNGYGICGLSYNLAFDDYSKAFNTINDPAFAAAEEEPRARTVKDYLTAVVSDQGQNILASRDYGALSAPILAIAREAVGQIGWAKSGSTGDGGNNNPPGGNPPGGNPPGGNPPGGNPDPGGNTQPPSNEFSISTATVSRAGTITITIPLPGAGTLTGTAKAKGKLASKGKSKSFSFGKVTLVVSQAGTAKLVIKPSSNAKKAMKANKKFKVTISITFTPTGGTANTKPRSVTVKGTVPKKK